MAAYATPADLLLGNVNTAGDDLQKWVDVAADEIDAALGFVYKLPLNPTPSAHVALLLKRCNVLIASGRWILDRAGVAEDTVLHAYGLSLLREGQGMLASITTGKIDLGVDRLDQFSTGSAPTVVNYDAVSPVDAFYAWATAGPLAVETGSLAPVWRPGQ